MPIKSATSETVSKRLIQSEGKTHYVFNVTGAPGLYSYDYVEIEGAVTPDKIYRAISEAEQNIVTEDTAASVAQEYIEITKKLREISAMSFAQIDTHIDTVFSALTVAQKTSLKKLYKAVLGLIKLKIK